ncbi:response regulator [Halobacillus seohaensis]|uniref:Response regulator n=1 Tax=Halobacillus seohaensis TaxID=447421 RepID=A0ABW2EQR1_9BACI
MIQVLIVEDDPMVAELNKKYVEQMKDFRLVGVAANVEEAHQWFQTAKIDLMLLDVYMPGGNGLDLLKDLREKNEQLDVILITAASDIEQIQQSLRFGAVDYLIKPFEFERLHESLTKYKENHSVLNEKRNVSQSELDQLFSKPVRNQNKRVQVPKGLTKTTLESIVQVILNKGEVAFSTDDIAKVTDISRVSVRKYLKFLKEIDFLEETLIYGVGRPVYQYERKGNSEVEYDFSVE